MENSLLQKTPVIIGIFPTRHNLEIAVERLKASGYQNDDFSASENNPENIEDFVTEKGVRSVKGIGIGAGIGICLGGLLGWIAWKGAIVIPQVLASIDVSPIVAGIVAGGLLGAWGGLIYALGVPDHVIKYQEDRKKNGGGIYLSVHCPNEESEMLAKDIFEETGAENITYT